MLSPCKPPEWLFSALFQYSVCLPVSSITLFHTEIQIIIKCALDRKK
ncbi:hypothetical protein D083_2645 [Dickeya solani RNS 08.23.3.1.A]|nr:hypothetical protein D083_2645 [Dickeya solani RNS 08.23.3.1.A]